MMRKYGIAARRKRRKYVYPGKASQVAPNLLRIPEEVQGKEIVFSDILEVRLSDGSRVRGCFALYKRTRAILEMAFDYHMRADLVTATILTMTFEGPGSICHSEEAQAIRSRADPSTAHAKRGCTLNEPGRHAHRQWVRRAFYWHV